MRKALKQNLKFRYRRLNKVPKKIMTNDYNRRMFENIAAQIAREENSYELIFFDEFKVASRHHNFYGWREKGKQGYINLFEEIININIIVAFSSRKLHLYQKTSKTIDSEYVMNFLKMLKLRIQEEKIKKIDEVILVWDNASYHKSDLVTKLVGKKSMKMMTIIPYMPWLNSCEHLIRAIKRKIREKQLHSRQINDRLVDKCINEVSKIDLKRFVSESLLETLNMMKFRSH